MPFGVFQITIVIWHWINHVFEKQEGFIKDGFNLLL